MEELKSIIIQKFSKEIEALDFTLDETSLSLKYNTIVENLFETIKIKKDRSSVPLHKTTDENNFNLQDTLCAGKSSETLLTSSYLPKNTTITTKQKDNLLTTIPDNFSLNYEMKQFAKLKHLNNIDDVFEDFKLYYQSKASTNSDWEAVWKRWVLNQNRYTNHLIKTTIDENMVLNTNMKNLAKKYIDQNHIELEFIKFKNHYLATGDLKVHSEWEKVWENWCINHKGFKPKEQSQKAKEKSDYRWDFRKAKDVSDRIKDWLEFEKGINWLDDYYWKDIPIPGIGWQKMIHPDFNKEEILLFKKDSVDGSFMLKHTTNDIIDAEVLEND
jgi:hypothetical protein